MKSIFVCVAMALVAVVPVTAEGANSVGELVTAGAALDGYDAPSGTTVLSPTVLETSNSPVIIQLSNGGTLAVGEDSRAVLDQNALGEILIELQSGSAALTGDDGQPIRLASNRAVRLSQDGEVKSGQRNDEDVVLCELLDPTPDHIEACHADPSSDDCTWRRISVAVADSQAFLDRGSVVAGKDNNELEIDCDAGGLLLGAGAAAIVGLSTAAKAGIIVGSVAGGAVLYDQVIDDDDDDDRVVSGVQ